MCSQSHGSRMTSSSSISPERMSFWETWSFQDAIGNAYRPLARNVYFWIGQRLFGHNPMPFHLVNLSVALSGLFLYFLVVRRMFASSDKRSGKRSQGGALAAHHAGEGPALLATLLFALHPAAGTPNTWVCGIQDLLLTTLVLAAAYCHMTQRRLCYVLSFAGALLSKEPAAFLPGILLLYDRLVLRHNLATALRRQACREPLCWPG